MSNIGVFSDFRTGINSDGSVSSQQCEDAKQKKRSKKVSNALKTAAPVVIPLAAIPVTALITYKCSTKNVAGLKTEISELSANFTNEIANLKALNEARAAQSAVNLDNVKKAGEKSLAPLWSALAAAAGITGGFAAGKITEQDKKEVSDKLSGRMNYIDAKSSDAVNTAQAAVDKAQQAVGLSGNSLSKKYTQNVNGVQLLTNNDSLSRNSQKYNKAIEKIRMAAPEHLYEKPDIKPITKEHPVLWSVTSEFAPIKEGGLGSVPVELQNNMTKLGIDIPTFIPMYQQKGVSSFRQEGDEYIYSYKGKDFNLKKAASFKLDAYKNGETKTENVEIYVNNTEDADGNNKQLVFVKNDTYFNGTIYQSSGKTEEPEKFAFFSKAVYEFAKAKEDTKSVKDLVITDKAAFDSVAAPDGLILNDWQASPIAALARYKAPMENAYGQLSDEAAEKLSDMRIITIGHNAMYQGSTQNNNDDAQRHEATTNVLNTLFDDFAYDIASNALTNASETDISDAGLKNLDNVLILNAHDGSQNHTNLLNLGICLSDYFHPVSQNYANEIISDDHPELAGELRWALNRKNDSGALIGIINGNDFNNLSIEAKAGQIEAQTGLDFKTYSKSSDISEVMEARAENKANFYKNFILPLSRKNDDNNHDEDVEKVRALSTRLEFVDPSGNTVLPVLSDDEIANTPIITSAGRLVSQKGVDVVCDAIKMLMNNWEKDFPGKPKPIFYLAGQDGENGKQRQYIEDLKEKGLSREDSNRVVFAHGYAPMASLMAGSDFFLLPSIFEPCGLTQGESFALATPVIASAVGGIVDTVNREDKTNGVLTDKNTPLNAEEFYNAMKKGLDIYFNNPEQYQNMVKDSLAEDFSWIQKGRQGPVYDYLDAIGIERSTLPDAE